MYIKGNAIENAHRAEGWIVDCVSVLPHKFQENNAIDYSDAASFLPRDRIDPIGLFPFRLTPPHPCGCAGGRGEGRGAFKDTGGKL